MMYPPLKFIEQLENYFTFSNAKSLESLINARVSDSLLRILHSDRSQFYGDYGIVRAFPNALDFKNESVARFNKALTLVRKDNNLPDSFDLRDFIDLMLYTDVKDVWGRNKLSYLVDNNLFDMFLTMKVPSLLPVDCLTKLPSEAIYIDWNGWGSMICQDLLGTFILTDETDTELRIVLLHLLQSSTENRVMNFTITLLLPLDGESKKFKPNMFDGVETVVQCEDGVERVVNEHYVMQAVMNFLIYLHASNRDVKISERTRKNHEKTNKVIKNKFREVKEFDVGFTYSRAISKDSERVRYVGKPASSGVVHTPKSRHYRSAHWHHYWTGTGKDKKLIIKWVEGVVVNGGRPSVDNVKVRKVK